MKLKLFSLTLLSLVTYSSVINAQESIHFKYQNSVNINCRLPLKLDRVRKTVDNKTDKVTVLNDTILESIVTNFLIKASENRLNFIGSDIFGIYERKTDKQFESGQINGSFSSDFKTLNRFEIVYRKKVYACSDEGEKYEREYVYTRIQLSNLVANGSGFVYKEDISGVIFSHERKWMQKGHLDINKNINSIDRDETRWPPGISIHFR